MPVLNVPLKRLCLEFLERRNFSFKVYEVIVAD